ncbi:hypothetical protein Glove_216g98 [Diversispora epigaea]|uniref:Uncharacterized protein n=1 Tax=Diversispora epigaea TaxID=1348612 RepID=A0A397INL6_9GLOM|nr:hypothetical protein Glove_216g98 [Diversispora epigaea]
MQFELDLLKQERAILLARIAELELRSSTTRLSLEAINDIITAKGTTNALPILAKKYNVSHAQIREIWEFAIARKNTNKEIDIEYQLKFLAKKQQNIKQLESSFHENKKQTADQAFNNNRYNFLYGIVSTSTDWHFIIFVSDGLYCTSKTDYQIDLLKSVVKEGQKSLRDSIKQIIRIIVGLLKDRIMACDEPKSKRRHVHEKIKQ